MKFIIRLGVEFSKLPTILLPLYFIVGPLMFWAGSENFQNNSILDRHATQTTGEIIGKKRERLTTATVLYKFKPKTAYSSVGTRGLLNTEEILEEDPTRNPRLHSASQNLSPFNAKSFHKGDAVTVEYALRKGKFVSRIHNPSIPILGITMMIFGIIFLSAPLCVLFNLITSRKRRIN